MPQFRSSPWRGSESVLAALLGKGWRWCRRSGRKGSSQTCERLVIRRPHHAAQNHAGIKTTPRDWWRLLTPSRLPVSSARNVLFDKCCYHYELREKVNEVGRSFFLTKVLDAVAALYLSLLINVAAIRHFAFEIWRTSKCVYVKRET